MRENKVNERGHDVLKKNRNFYIGVGGTVLEGLLSGSLFMLLYSVMQFLWSGQFDMNRVLVLTGVIAGIFLLRILIYSYGYTKAQIGGAEVSKNIRLFMGDHLKRIPLYRFTTGGTGDYINIITSDVNNYEKILTHKIGDLAKSFSLSLMLVVFVMTIYVPAGIILLTADLLLIPSLWLSFRMVRKYGNEKNAICAENVSSIVEYVSGIQTFRAYGVGGMKNKSVVDAMREFSRISFVYEAKVLPVGAGFSVLSWLACPLVIWVAYAPWAAGTLEAVDYLLICMLPLFCAKLSNTIFVDLTSYKNLMISKNKILSVMKEPEETGSMKPFQTDTHDITFENVDFSYVSGEPVLQHASFTVPDQKLTAIVGDSGSGKSTILNLLAKYYEPTSGTISIGGQPINHVAAERVLEQISMVDQDVFLFDDTIRDNIRHARPEATDEEIEAACRAANCDGFIRKMEKGYDTPTGENGNLLSGGQRQRISIARAILKDSPILLLDEATASLDIENELAVKQAIANLLKEKKTVVMIAHTLSIVKNADLILVVADGKIAEAGTHDELLAKGGKYAAMWNAEQKISA
ncbi:MAG: ABC transporter ATP-binding protein [Peptococcaceae bacterium]|nr:ABC transporter ATP-binding protein [Peptococcaceae bacterium]